MADYTEEQRVRYSIREIGAATKAKQYLCAYLGCTNPATHYLVWRGHYASIGLGRESRYRRCDEHIRYEAQRLSLDLGPLAERKEG